MIQDNKFIVFLTKTLNITTDLANKIVSQYDFIELKKGDFFLKLGNICEKRLFIHSGFLRSYIIDYKEQEITTGFYSENQIVSEPMSFFNKTKSKESIQAITDCKGWAISFEKMNMLFHNHPEFREFGRILLLRDYVELKQFFISTITETAENRYLSLLKQHPDLIKNVPLKYIASYLGVTDTSLSRIRKLTAKKEL